MTDAEAARELVEAAIQALDLLTAHGIRSIAAIDDLLRSAVAAWNAGKGE